MKRILVLCLVLCFMPLFAIHAAADSLTVNLEVFETIFDIWADYYQVEHLPEMQQRGDSYCYYMADYSIIAKLYETGEIRLIMIFYNRPIDFDFIAVSACVTSSTRTTTIPSLTSSSSTATGSRTMPCCLMIINP